MFLETWKDLAECDTAAWMSGNIGQTCKCHIWIQGMQQGLSLLSFLDPFTVHMRMFWEFFLFLFVLSSFVSWCHGGNTSAVSYFQDSEEAVCDILEKHFSSTCCCLGMAGNLMSPDCVPPKLRILTHRSTISQPMPGRHRSLSVKHKLHISVLPHNSCRRIPTKQHLLAAMEIMHALIHCNVRHLSNLLRCVFWNLACTVLNFFTAVRNLQKTSSSLHKPLLSNSTFCRIWIFCCISGICPSFFKTNTELKLTSTYKFLFYCVQENGTVEWFDMRRERLLSPSAFGKYVEFSVFQNSVGVADSVDLPVCSVLHLYIQLLWIDFPGTVPEQGFRKTWIRIWEFESILYPFIFLFMKGKVILIFSVPDFFSISTQRSYPLKTKRLSVPHNIFF